MTSRVAKRIKQKTTFLLKASFSREKFWRDRESQKWWKALDSEQTQFLRLELESFRQVDFRYPAKLVWCGT